MSSAPGTPAARALELARRHGYFLESVLAENARKRTGVYRVRKAGRHFVLKCVAEDSPADAREALRAEIDFYARHRSRVIPPLAESAEGMLVVAQVEGTPLRQLLTRGALDDHSLTHVLAAVKEALDVLYADCRSEGTDTPTTAVAFRHLRSLTRSGPRSSRRPGFLSRLAGRCMEMRLRPRLRRALISGGESFQAPGFAHGDLHFDNILVEPRGATVWFLDFEKSDRTSAFDLDLLYLIVMIERALAARDTPSRQLRELFSDVLGQPVCAEIAAVFRAGVAVNPRFNG